MENQEPHPGEMPKIELDELGRPLTCADAAQVLLRFKNWCFQKDISIGSVMQLVSGGFPMTVTGFSDDCSNGEGQLELRYATDDMGAVHLAEVTLPAKCLRKYDPRLDYTSSKISGTYIPF